MQKLEQYKKPEPKPKPEPEPKPKPKPEPEQKYYNLIDIIADPYFLVACYEEIAKKKGN
jgi:hypothetical protein